MECIKKETEKTWEENEINGTNLEVENCQVFSEGSVFLQ
jgi:hypothetical protein